MNRKAYAGILGFVFLALAFLPGCGSSHSTTTPPVVAIAATSGSGQSATVSTAFTNPLVATVTTGGTPKSGVTVTFTAPATGASGTFANGTATDTETTGANGMATSTVFTANGTAGGPYTVTASATGATAAASFSLTNAAAAGETITATSGSGQSATVSTAFTNPLVATVTTGGTPNSGVTVTFTAPATGASGTFAQNGTVTDTETTDANGLATSTAFTANGTAGGPYTVTASATGTTATASFSLTNTAVPATNYSFYLNGLEDINEAGSNLPNFYALAGSVAIDASGNVVGGEQDYNDAIGFTFTDTILAGTAALQVDPTTGQGTLTLNTGDTSLGVNGIETLGVQFVNSNHALVVQFDGTATSSGSLDLQTSPSTPLPNNAGYAFTLSGVDTGSLPIVAGGVFSIGSTGGTLSGVVDVDDFGQPAPTFGTAFTGTISAPDSFGRGTITGTGIALTLNYYIVGPEAIRIIDMDDFDTGVGSAFGQGFTQGVANTFNNTLPGAPCPTTPANNCSVFEFESNSYGVLYAVLGMFSSAPTSGTYTGVADENELSSVSQGPTPIAGSYAVASNGYGSLTVNAFSLSDISTLGIYLTDPNLNLNDPNNTSTGLGGALIADLDNVNGTGVLVPQTDTATASFAGNYAFGAQDYNDQSAAGWEFDFVGLGTVASNGLGGNVLTGTGLVSDPFFFFSGTPTAGTDSGVTFSGTAVPDSINTGRYTMYSPKAFGISVASSVTDFNIVIYQASGGQLFWLDGDLSSGFNSVFLGPLEQQGSLTGLPGAKRARAKTTAKRKQ